MYFSVGGNFTVKSIILCWNERAFVVKWHRYFAHNQFTEKYTFLKSLVWLFGVPNEMNHRRARVDMNDKQNKKFLIVSGMIFILSFIGFMWFIRTRMTFLLNSDDSSELILGQLLANENKLLSKSWYYSTELRVVNTQIFYAFFFKIFHSWHRVRIASYCCLYIVMIAAYYFACRGLRIKRYFLVTAALLMIPFSEGYFSFVLKGAYYIPHIAITFFTLGLCEGYVAEKKETRQKIYLLVALFSSVLASMGGARQVIILYIPLIAVSTILVLCGLSVENETLVCKLDRDRGDKKQLIFAAVSFVGAIIGYIINSKFLSKIYSFKLWDDISFTGFDISKLSQILNGFMSSYGYSSGKIFSSSLLCNFLCFGWFSLTVCACVHILKNKKNVEPVHFRMALFTITDFVVFILLYMFTNLSYADRYNLPVIILSIPMIAILFKHTGFKNVINYAAITIFVLLVACSGYLFCKEKYKADDTAELRDIVAVLQNEEYTEGYTTFWRANVLTELSNGAIEVWNWQDSGRDQHITVGSIDDTHKWLQLKSHDNTHPEGKVFLLFTKNEWENNPWVGKLSTEHVVYQSDGYIVIGYENYDKLRYDATQQQ